MRLWDADGVDPDESLLAFTVGDDPVWDLQLLPFDCLASAAHARMLCEIGVIAPAELEPVLAALREARAESLAGRFRILPEHEDGHTALELFLVERAGEAGRRIHTGRSRNDQVIAALRLLVRERLVGLAARVADLAESLLTRSAEERTTPLPGYTHTRQAMPSTVGQLLAGVAEGLVHDLELFPGPLHWAHRSALGSGSGYGVPLPLDRERVAELLGLDDVDVNTVQVQNTRGKLEAATLGVLHQVSLTLGRFAADLVWFSSEAFGYFRLPVRLTTGSSIMPQKRNPDLFELARAVPASMLGRYVEVTATLHGLPAGYHRDLQRTKPPVLAGLREARALVEVMTTAVAGLEVDRAACAAALRDEIFATDRVYDLVRQGIPFRDAYRRVKEASATGSGSPEHSDPRSQGDADAPLRAGDPALQARVPTADFLASRTHLGAPGTEQEPLIRDRLRSAVAALDPYVTGIETARRSLES
ncbi:MAG: argininosuccinate lyase [Candidatus Eisenbacteria bacterium]|uniref:argininosuccinate lyase n=1 Tax=Eiseniibacteriota bacterium TaxID=2212470 RepID=A0A956LXV5_UNCEI|nr:argininosuccinate lyase [Candidatus Eisenbacteria bacterium]